MNILAEVKSFLTQISDSICSLNKTQTRILILITSIKKVPVFSLLIKCLATKPRYATERPNELTHKFSELKMPGKSSSGKVVLCSSTFTYQQVLSLRSFAKQTELKVLAISSAVRGFHVYKDIWKPSETNSPVKGSSIIALTYLPSKLSTTEKPWAIYHTF